MIKVTEREIAADIKAHLDALVQKGGYNFERVTVEPSAARGAAFPDVAVWTDYQGRRAFAFFELKQPGKKEDLAKLPDKAAALGAKFVIVWNFQTGTFYEVAGGQLTPRKSYPTPLLNKVSDWKNKAKQIAAYQQAEVMLDDLERLRQGKGLKDFQPDKFYFIGVLREAVDRLHPVLEAHILAEKKNRQRRNIINSWASKQGIPTGQEHVIARQWAYSLAVRVLFYFTVRRHHSHLPALKPPPISTKKPGQSLSNELRSAFSRAQAVDWQAVFEPGLLDSLGLPPQAEPALENLLTSFHRYDFGLLKEDIIGEILEGLIPEDERHALGQYFTREDLVDLIIGFVADDDEAHYLDPTCGSGAFLTRLYSRLRWLSTYRAPHSDLLSRIWGVDIAHFPAELATINLFRQKVEDTSNFPRVLVKDFFDIHPGQVFRFPPPRADSLDYRKVEEEFPQCRGIVGNFPYIRQELIERQEKGYKRKLTQAIASYWFWRDRELFEVRGIPDQDLRLIETSERCAAEKNDWLERQVDKGQIDLRLSGQADIYAYLFLHATRFLEEGGRIGVLTSNSWLDVSYGAELKRFLLRHFKIIAIAASWAEPWFQDASVNTVFTILERCEDEDERAANIVRFVKIREPLDSLLSADLLLEENKRWLAVNELVDTVEMADAQVQDWDARGAQPLTGVHTVEDARMRIRLMPQRELATNTVQANEEDKGDRHLPWGPYLRAPQVYFDLLDKKSEELIPLTDVADSRFGTKTGRNAFFYLEIVGQGSKPELVRVRNGANYECEMERECLQSVIKSPKEAERPVVDPDGLRYYLFRPPGVGVTLQGEESKDEPEVRRELLQRGWQKAYDYVVWGAQQKTSSGKLWTEGASLKNRSVWWLLGEHDRADFLTMGFVNRRFFILENKPRVAASDVMFEWYLKLDDEEERQVTFAILNSSITYLSLETVGRWNLGGGVLKVIGPELERLNIVDPSRIDASHREKIISAYEKLKHRPVKSIDQEVKQPDRQALDDAVLEALGLDPLLYREPIYDGLVEMVDDRLRLPKMRRRGKNKIRRQSTAKVKEQIRQEIIPNGPRPIEAFLPASNPPMEQVNVSGRPVNWKPMFTRRELVDADGRKVGTLEGNDTKARYVIYAARPNVYQIEVPIDDAVVGKAVDGYHAYLDRLGEKLFKRAAQATRDARQSERIVREMLKDYDLLPLAIERAMR